MDNSEALTRRILRDIKVEVAGEIDRNFERQAFFSKAWQRSKSPLRGNGHILVNTGTLRRSVRSRSDASSITFFSDLPYAAIHNEGGEIKVTAKMKRYFWHKYYEACGGFIRKKSGALSRSKKQEHLNSVAEFWKAMALMKVGSTIKIPQRRFIGTDPEMEASVKTIIENNVTAFIREGLEETLKKK